MKVLICGSRDYTDWETFRDVLEKIAYDRFPRLPEDRYGNFLYDVTVIAGGAKGADTLAVDWAVVNGTKYEEYKADWDRYGKRAGYVRNKQMLDEGHPDLVIAFPKDKEHISKGTAMMIDIARRANVEVIIV